MRLSDLAAYAEAQYHLEEAHKWADFPGFSVIADPDSGKWVALLMRQWDTDTGTEIERCDLKCGREALDDRPAPYLVPPVRMRGPDWVGIVFDDQTEEEAVCRLFDRAYAAVRARRFNLVIPPGDGGTVPRGQMYGETLIPPRPSAGAVRGTDTQESRIRTKQSDGPVRGTDTQDPRIPAEPSAGPSRGTNTPETGIPGKTSAGPAGPAHAPEMQIPLYPGEKDGTAVFRGSWIPERPVRVPDHEGILPAGPAGGTYPRDGGSARMAGSAPVPVPEKLREMRRLYQYGIENADLRSANFCRQAAFMADYEDNVPWKGDFTCYFPTYQDLTLHQLRGYFTWRTHVRKGEYGPVASAAAYIYIYELLNGIGADSPEDTLEKLRAFETGFLDAGFGDGRMRTNLRRWMMEFSVVKGLPPERAVEFLDPELRERDAALEVLKDPDSHTDEEVFSALCLFGGPKTAASPVLTGDPARGMRLFSAVWRAASGDRTRSRSIFVQCFGSRAVRAWYPLVNAIYREDPGKEDVTYEMDACRVYRRRNGGWQVSAYDRLHFNRPLFQGLIHETDARLRQYLKRGRYLKHRPEDEWVTPYVDTVIMEEQKALEAAARPEVRIDLSGLDRIRADAVATRDSLLTEEETDAWETAMPEAYRDPEGAGLHEGAEHEYREPEGAGLPEGAGTLYREPEGSGLSEGAEHAYREPEGAWLPEGTGTLYREPEGAGLPQKAEAAEDRRELPLDDVLIRVLCTLLKGGDPGPLLKAHHILPSIAADTVNEALFDEIGDNAVLCGEDGLSLEEDYTSDLELLLGGYLND